MMKKLLLGAVLAFCGAIAWADDPITGGEWSVDGDYTTIVSGTCRLVGQTTTTHININAGATLVLDADNLFTKSPVVHMDGTLDLNGHSCKILRLVNLTRTDYPRACTARIVNNAAADVLVFMNSASETAFYGKIEETQGKIVIRGPNTTFNLFGPDGAMAVSAVTNMSESILMPYSSPLKVRIVLQPSLAGSYNLRLAEIGLTYQGQPVPTATARLVKNGVVDETNISYLVDGNAATTWRAETAEAQTIELAFATGYIPRVDGFRLTPYDEGGLTRYRPGGWDVYTYRSDSAGWVLASSVRNFTGWSSRQNSATTNLLFTAENRLGSVFGETTDITLDSSSLNALRVSTIDPLKTGALHGSGGVRIENGSTLAPGSLADYKGSFTVNACTTPDMQAKLALSSRGGAEQPVAITSRQNLAVVNGGTEPVAVLLDDSRTESLFGRLADGANGSLGLVKRGSGTRVLETEDATYTGETKVAEGTLVVARARTTVGTVSAKCLRFTPLTTAGTDASYPWAANELQLLNAEGAVIPWPTGTTAAKPTNTKAEHGTSKIARFVDGDTKTRMLMPPYSDTTTGFAPITVTLPTAVSFAGYRWVSTRDNSADKKRTPLTWRLEISDNGTAWRTCDLGEQAWSAEEESATWTGGMEGFPRTVSAMRGSATAGTGLVTLPETFLKKPGDHATTGTLAARYFRFRVLDVESTTASQYAYGWQLAEIGLLKNGQRVDWPEGVTIELKGGSLNVNNNSKLENLVNNVIWESGKGEVNQTRESAFVQEYPSFVVIDAGEVMSFDAYSLVGVKNYWYRMPSAWTLEVSADGTSWTLVDAVGGHALTLAQRNQGDGYPEMGPFALRYPLLDRGAGNSIGDASPVSIAEGATLRLATDYEKFGALSGAGTLDLELNAVGELTAADTTFSGSVTGSGTLILSGDGTQFFDNADLTGVKTLVFDGGAIGGSATFGALDVTGQVQYELAMTAEELAKGSCTRQILTATSLTAGAKTALAAGTAKTPLPSRGWKLTVGVTDTAVVVKACRNGLVVFLR